MHNNLPSRLSSFILLLLLLVFSHPLDEKVPDDYSVRQHVISLLHLPWLGLLERIRKHPTNLPFVLHGCYGQLRGKVPKLISVTIKLFEVQFLLFVVLFRNVILSLLLVQQRAKFLRELLDCPTKSIAQSLLLDAFRGNVIVLHELQLGPVQGIPNHHDERIPGSPECVVLLCAPRGLDVNVGFNIKNASFGLAQQPQSLIIPMTQQHFHAVDGLLAAHARFNVISPPQRHVFIQFTLFLPLHEISHLRLQAAFKARRNISHRLRPNVIKVLTSHCFQQGILFLLIVNGVSTEIYISLG
mmetsp:Transcript_8683/g.17609  ORF Transcript_8683/g.17609 Transcript_8683/m.17609 type:complete len:299 (-) Transcript_8683:1029-1925(-)